MGWFSRKPHTPGLDPQQPEPGNETPSRLEPSQRAGEPPAEASPSRLRALLQWPRNIWARRHHVSNRVAAMRRSDQIDPYLNPSKTYSSTSILHPSRQSSLGSARPSSSAPTSSQPSSVGQGFTPRRNSWVAVQDESPVPAIRPETVFDRRIMTLPPRLRLQVKAPDPPQRPASPPQNDRQDLKEAASAQDGEAPTMRTSGDQSSKRVTFSSHVQERGSDLEPSAGHDAFEPLEKSDRRKLRKHLPVGVPQA